MQTASKFIPEPDPFSDDEFLAWRGFMRAHATVTGELDKALRAEHGMSLEDYGVLITLVTVPEMRLKMGELGSRRLVSASKISRTVDQLERAGLVVRTVDPDDKRSFFATLSQQGLKRLREAQVTHHRIVRERLLEPLGPQRRRQLATIWEAAMPGISETQPWPPRTEEET